MKRRKINWRNVAILTTGIIAAATPAISRAATIERGYFAVGGEWLIWTFPMAAYMIWETYQEVRACQR